MTVDDCLPCSCHRLIQWPAGWTALCQIKPGVRRIVQDSMGERPLTVRPDSNCPRRPVGFGRA